MATMLSTIAAKLLAETIPVGTCLVNLRRNPSQQYPTLKVNGKMEGGHRIVWQAANGPIPDGMVIHHVCERQRCLNIEHLEMLTRNAHSLHHQPKRERCAKHDRLYDRTNPRGDGVCRLCAREAEERYYAKDPERARARHRRHQAKKRARSAG